MTIDELADLVKRIKYKPEFNLTFKHLAEYFKLEVGDL